MTQIGDTMMYEQAGPKQLVRDVALAEEAGFDFQAVHQLRQRTTSHPPCDITPPHQSLPFRPSAFWASVRPVGRALTLTVPAAFHAG